MNIAGKFVKIDERFKENPDGKTVIGLMGNFEIKDINEKALNHIKFFYGMKGKSYKIVEFYPVKINQRFYNGFIIFDN